MSCESTSTTSGRTEDFLVYQSQNLEDRASKKYGDATRALENAVEYIEGAFGKTDHSATASYSTLSPDLNYECWDSFSQDDPCAGYNKVWNNPKEYFKRWLECNNYSTGGTQTIFLTDCDDVYGGIGGDITWTQSGANVLNLPTNYQEYGTKDSFAGMSTVLHEIGHHMMRGSCVNSDYSEHHYGRLSESTYGLQIKTPMGKWHEINPSENACCQHHYSGDTRWRMTWSDCCLATWRC